MSAEDAAAKWLDEQNEGALRIAREIIAQRQKAMHRVGPGAEYGDGLIAGLRLALSHVSDRPGDISQTGAEGFITDVEYADDMLSEQEGGNA